MASIPNQPPLVKARVWSVFALLLAALVIGSVGADGALAASKKKDPGLCTLSQSATGDLIATGSGLIGNTSYQYEVYSAPQASVGGGELSADAFGSFSADLGPLSFYMNVYPNETTLTFDLYPIVGNKADMGTVAASCSI
jgi:hypothetical protein